MKIFIIYLIAVNIAGFALMGVDKRRAVRHRWRIRESALFIVAAIGGSVGVLLGMLIFRHKTKHLSFEIGVPAILVVQVVALILIFRNVIH